MLASLVIADRVTITTRTHTVRAEAGIRFVCDSRTYAAEPYYVARPGRGRRTWQSIGPAPPTSPTISERALLRRERRPLIRV